VNDPLFSVLEELKKCIQREVADFMGQFPVYVDNIFGRCKPS
jgi:hypothetical protein